MVAKSNGNSRSPIHKRKAGRRPVEFVKYPDTELPGDGISLDRSALLVLAAGASSRMGMPKALIELDDRPILEHILTVGLLDALADVVVVLGHDAEAVGAVAKGCGRRTVVNADPDRGRTGSVQTGLRALRSGIDGVFLQPVDGPLVGRMFFAPCRRGSGGRTLRCRVVEGERGIRR
jgi:molybdopterin-guanine dinucleotide biosynthesis protein A